MTHADIMTEPSGRSKGCAVVEYSAPEHAQRAIAELNDTDLMGRLIFVREDREDSGEVRLCRLMTKQVVFMSSGSVFGKNHLFLPRYFVVSR